MVSIRKFLIGLGLIPNSSLQSTQLGELEVLSTDSNLYYNNGTSAQIVDTASNTVTLTNKSMSGSANTFTNLPASALSGTVSLTTQVSGALPVANGGTNSTSAQTAINTLAGAVTSGDYLRGNGTNVVMSTIQVGDVPTLNQNTTGTAANITATSNSTLTTLSNLSLTGTQVTGNISGNAANVTGTVAVANGGTGDASLTAYAVLTGGTTSTGALQQVSGLGTAGQVLTSNGASALPTWQLAKDISWQAVQTSNFNAVVGDGYPVNTTSGAITATLPASPSAGNIVMFLDYAGTFGTNNLTIANNGNNINGIASNVVITTNRESIGLVYIDATQGWIPYDGFNTMTPKSAVYSVQYLVVAGGGGGNSPGPGGAGGLLQGTSTLNASTVYTITVGGGGAGASSGNATTGSNSVLSGSGFSTVTALGGGFGAAYPNTGGSGGSGGGGTNGNNPGSGTGGQGNAGGSGSTSGTGAAGGGGGAGAVGVAGTSGVGGNGGIGVASSITGTSTFYAGGGGGATGGSTQGSGGTGGGGAAVASGTGGAGTANTGGGGGGSQTGGSGGVGGSGVVILSIATANYTGTTTGSPTVITSGSNTILKFTASGTYTA
jgi:hypothetical protein